MKRSSNAELMLGQGLRRWPNINSALVYRLEFTGVLYQELSIKHRELAVLTLNYDKHDESGWMKLFFYILRRTKR